MHTSGDRAGETSTQPAVNSRRAEQQPTLSRPRFINLPDALESSKLNPKAQIQVQDEK
jgi:hypothetical protein